MYHLGKQSPLSARLRCLHLGVRDMFSPAPCVYVCIHQHTYTLDPPRKRGRAGEEWLKPGPTSSVLSTVVLLGAGLGDWLTSWESSYA